VFSEKQLYNSLH